MSSDVTKRRIASAFQAMKNLGISEDKVKPVLKKLVKLYEKNWELIEAENYRALADAIFERDEEVAEPLQQAESSEAVELSKKIVNKEDGNEAEEETKERPLKRLRPRDRNGLTSSNHTSNTGATKTSLIRPKEEPDQLPEAVAKNTSIESQSATCQSIGNSKGKRPVTHESSFSEGRVDSVEPIVLSTSQQNSQLSSDSLSPVPPVSPRDRGNGSDIADAVAGVIKEESQGNNKGKQPVTHEPLIIQETSDSVQPSGMGRNQQNTLLRSESITPVHRMRLRDRGKGPVSSQISSKEKKPRTESSPHGLRLKEQKVEPNIVSSSKRKGAAPHVLIEVEDEPTIDEMPLSEAPNPDPVNGGGSLSKNRAREDNGLIPTVHSGSQPDRTVSNGSSNGSRNDGELAVPSGVESASLDTLTNAEVIYTRRTRASERNGTHDGPKLKKMSADDESGTGKGKQAIHADQTNMSSVGVQETPEMISSFRDIVDIAKGQENVVITLKNDVNDESPPSFYYIPKNAIFQDAHVNASLARIGDTSCCSTCFGDCLSLETPCVCSYETGGEFAYTSEGLVKEELLEESISMNRDPKKHCQFFCKECPLERSKNEDSVEHCKGHLVRRFIKECWLKCGCHQRCGNRVVQRGISRKLQVFMTPEGKGWGLRTLEELPKGAFVCEYVGEVLTNAELFDRVLHKPEGEKHSYPVLLDADWCAEGVLKDEDALCLDATYYGNVARFINHRCYDSTLVEIPVEVETPDHHYYHLAFFTTRKLKAMEELTWDYGIDFDDVDHPIKAFSCHCGSKHCRNIKRNRSRSRR